MAADGRLGGQRVRTLSSHSVCNGWIHQTPNPTQPHLRSARRVAQEWRKGARIEGALATCTWGIVRGRRDGRRISSAESIIILGVLLLSSRLSKPGAGAFIASATA